MSFLKKALVLFLTTIFFLIFFKWLFFEVYVIPSESMKPTLLVHDYIVVSKMSYGIRLPKTHLWILRWKTPQRGEVVVFESVQDPEMMMVKRVIGLPGDRIDFKEGKLFINGKKVQQRPLKLDKLARFWQMTDLDPHENEIYEETLDGKTYQVVYHKKRKHLFNESYMVSKGHYFVLGDNRDDSQDSRVWGEVPVEKIEGKAVKILTSCQLPAWENEWFCLFKKKRPQRIFLDIR